MRNNSSFKTNDIKFILTEKEFIKNAHDIGGTELSVAYKKLLSENEQKEKKILELIAVNKSLLRENAEKDKLSSALILAGKNLAFQNAEKERLAFEWLRESEAKFRSMYENNMDGILLITGDGFALSANKAACEMFEMTEDEICKSGRHELVDKADNRLLALLEERNRTGKVKGEVNFIRKNGSKFPAEVTSSVFDDEYGNRRISLIVRDITQNKNIEEELKSSENRYRQIVETSQEGIWLVDENKITTFVNNKMCEILGFTEQEMMGSQLFQFMDEAGIEIATRNMQEMTNGGQQRLDFKFISKAKQEVWTSLSANPLFSKEGVYIGALAMITDITESRKNEIERAKMVSDLIQRNVNLEQFSYIISHNLRSPVANILGTMTIINQSDLDSKDKIILHKALNDSVKKLDGVVKDLSHILEVKTHINEIKERFYLSEMVKDIKISILDKVKQDNVQIHYNFSQADEIFSIKSYIYSIFYNLISNGIKYRNQAQKESYIEIKSHKIKNRLALTFTDNGLGMDMKKRSDQIFGLYKRFHPGIEGKGMGLFMVKTQVETLGGKISVSSEVGKGTEFRIELEEQQ